MKYNMLSAVTWVNADPRRLFFLMMVVAVLLMLVLSAIPNHVTYAGWQAGGSD